MTTIKVIGSSSSGNGYILTSSGESLILELGCRPFDYYYAQESSFVGCCVSHSHTDHLNPSTVKEMIRRGNIVCVGEKVYDYLKERNNENGLYSMPEKKKTFIGHYEIQPFQVHHNVPNYGFLIVTPSKERIVFVTDATECKYRFKDIDCIMVECNHDDDTLLDNLDKHEVSMSHPENHMGLQECISFCKANYNSSLKRIILIHLSSSNISEHYALESVQETLPYCEPVVPVAVAHPNDTFLIENDNF